MKDRIANLEENFTKKLSHISDTVTDNLRTELPERLNENLSNLETTMKAKIDSYNNDLGGRLDKCLGAIPNELNRTWTSLFNGNEEKSTEPSSKTPTNFRALLQDEMQKQKKEEDDRDQRANNIVIYRVKESQKTKPEERKSDDLQFFRSLCTTINVGEKQVKNIIRLGAKTAENGPRPVKIMLENNEDKTEIMKNLTKLKNAEEKFKNVSVTHDLTDEQIKIRKEKIDQAGEMTKNDESGQFFYKVRGPPWNLRIIRVKKSSNQQNVKGQEVTKTS